MPLIFTSFVVPSSSAIPFLMEDIYLRGGYRCVATTAARDAIPVSARKAGMLVYCQDTGLTFTVNVGALTTWVPVITTPVRNSITYTAASAIAANGTLDFTIDTGLTSIIQTLTVSDPSLKIEAFSTVARNDANPYTFISYTGHLTDDGSSKLQDNSISFGRRYGILCNLEATPIVTTYWRITNTGASSVTPSVSVSWLPLE